MISQQGYQSAFDNFIQDTEAVESAIWKATEAGFGGSGYSLELFGNGTHRILRNDSIGKLYTSPGIVIGISRIDNDEYDFDNAIKSLRDKFDEYLSELFEWENELPII